MKLFPKLLLLFLGASLLTSAITVLLLRPLWTGYQDRAESESAAAYAIELLESEGVQALERWQTRRIRAGAPPGILLTAEHKPVAQLPRRHPLHRLLKWHYKTAAGDERRKRVLLLPVASGDTAYFWLGARRPVPKTEYDVLLVRLAVLVMVMALAAWVASRWVSQPVRTLRDKTKQVAKGDFDGDLSLLAERRDEIGQLAQDLSYMSEQVEKLLQSHKQLLSDVSHELRSPLARQAVALALIEEKLGSNPQLDDAVGDYVARTAKESDRLEQLIAEILALAKLDAQPELNKVDVALAPLLRRLVDDANFEAAAKAINVKLNIAPVGDARLSADMELLRRAFENVIRNALRYSPTDSDILVSLSQSERNGHHGYSITVADNGPGVPQAELEKIFSPFQRLDAARNRESGGVGLGLAITKRAVQAHGGVVSAEQNQPTGLVVSLWLPQC